MIQKITITLFFFFSFASGTNALSQWIQDISANDPNSVYCLAVSGTNLFAGGLGNSSCIWISTNNGESWVPRGKIAQWILSLATNGSNIFVGTNDSGVWRSTDDGNTWQSVNDNLTSNLTVYGVALKGQNIFAIGYGIFVSNDAGKNWKKTSNEIQYEFSSTPLAISGQNIYAATQGGLLRSTNDGLNWTAVRRERTWAVAADSTNVFVSSDSGFLQSTDNGINWISGNRTGGLERGLLYINGHNIFSGGSRTNTDTYFISKDYGKSWIDIGQLHRATSLVVSGPNIVVGSNNVGIHYRPLSDFGISEVKNQPHPDLNISLSPNPTTGIIAVHNALANILHVTVSSILGESVLELPHPNAADFTLDLSKFPPGTYFARFTIPGSDITRKIVKE